MWYQAISLVVCAILLIACATVPDASGHHSAISGRDRTIYVTNHGWHTGVILPLNAIENALPEVYQRFAGKKFVEIGWGDEGFYQAEEITLGLAMKATLWPTESVLHLAAFSTAPALYFRGSEVQGLQISTENLDSLISFISESFSRDAHGNVIALGKGIYGESLFYRGVGTYFLFNTCNKWTARALESAGEDIAPMYKLTAGSISDYLKRRENVRLSKEVISD